MDILVKHDDLIDSHKATNIPAFRHIITREAQKCALFFILSIFIYSFQLRFVIFRVSANIFFWANQNECGQQQQSQATKKDNTIIIMRAHKPKSGNDVRTVKTRNRNCAAGQIE